jgi:hypothetical protein
LILACLTSGTFSFEFQKDAFLANTLSASPALIESIETAPGGLSTFLSSQILLFGIAAEHRVPHVTGNRMQAYEIAVKWTCVDRAAVVAGRRFFVKMKPSLIYFVAVASSVIYVASVIPI